MNTPIRTPDVVIIGGGPSGLRAAAGLAPHLEGGVLLLERESTIGGMPRHCVHTGYGIKDMRRFTSGPNYARILAEATRRSGAEIQTNATVTGWSEDGSLEVSSPRGRFCVAAKAVILATGARERPRAARRIPGDRPEGVYTTGQLQNLVHIHKQKVGTKAVIVGSELVSWSAALTLRRAGCSTVLLTTRYEKPDVYRLFSAVGKIFFGTKVATTTSVVRVIGRVRVEGVELENDLTGERSIVECDTVVFTADWIPDHELARSGGIPLNPRTLGPSVDTALRTKKPGVFAVGNLIHPVDSADGASLDGTHVVPHVLRYLKGEDSEATLEVEAGEGLAWVSPNLISPKVDPPRGYLLAWPTQLRPRPQIVVAQGGREVGRVSTRYPAAPGRVYRIPATVLNGIDHQGGTISISIT